MEVVAGTRNLCVGCVCVYVCICVFVSICMCVCINVCVAALLKVCECVSMCVYVCVYVHVCVSTGVLVHMCECVMGSNIAQRLRGQSGSHIVLISNTDSVAPLLSMQHGIQPL